MFYLGEVEERLHLVVRIRTIIKVKLPGYTGFQARLLAIQSRKVTDLVVLKFDFFIIFSLCLQ